MLGRYAQGTPYAVGTQFAKRSQFPAMRKFHDVRRSSSPSRTIRIALGSACRKPRFEWHVTANCVSLNSLHICARSLVAIHGAEITTCDASALRRRVRNSAALVIAQTSAVTPIARRLFAVLSAVTPNPIWLIARFAAKFL